MLRVVPWFALLVLLAACDKETKPLPPNTRNNPPEIRTLSHRPQRVLASQEIQVICGARDRDLDPLAYWWTAEQGSFPGGNKLPIVRWRSPIVRGTVRMTVHVADFAETVAAHMDIPMETVAPPDSLKFVNGSSLIDLSWNHPADRSVEHWTGYEVYGATRSLAALPPDSIGAYRLTEVAVDRLQYRVVGVVPGVKSFYHVRSRRDYRGTVEISETGPEIDTAARLRGFGSSSLYEVGSRRGAFGVSLPTGAVIPLDPSQTGRFDIYLGTNHPADEGGALRLKSVHLLAYRDPAWSGRETGIRDIGTDWSVSVAPTTGYGPEAPALVGRVYAIRTAEGHYGKFQINELRGSSPERRAEFQWAWQPLAGYPRF